MARQFLTGLDLNQNELSNARIQNLPSAPTVAVAGQFYFDTTLSQLSVYSGTEWLLLAVGGDLQAAIDALSTSDIEEGTRLYFTEARAKTAAAELLVGATKGNITITGTGAGLVITAENGVADSDTDDLTEGATNKYFTDLRARTATAASYDVLGAAAAAQSAATTNTDNLVGDVSVDGSAGNTVTNRIATAASAAQTAATTNTANLIGDVTVDGTSGDTVTDRIATAASAAQTAATTNTANLIGDVTVTGSAGNTVTDRIASVTTSLDAHTSSSTVHGITGIVVGSTDSQSLTNKTLGTGTVLSADVDANGNTITDLGAPVIATDAATKGYVDTEVSDHSAATTGVHGISGEVVGTSDAQTLTAKILGAGTSLSSSLNANGSTIVNLSAPVNDNDAATKAYVDSVAEGLSIQQAVKALADSNVDLSSSVLAVDSVSIVSGDRVLLIAQTDSAENGIYVSNGTTLARATDYNTAIEVATGDFVFVDSGSVYANTGWVQTEPVVTLGTDNVLFSQFSGAGTFTAGNGLVLNGSEFDVVGTVDRITVGVDSVDIADTYVGQTSITTLGTVTTGTWNGDTIAVASGGTGAITPAAARANLGATTKYTAANPTLTQVGGIATWSVVHNLGIRSVIVQVYEIATYEQVEVDVERTNTNDITLSWVSAADVPVNSYQVVIIG
jgi:hypothetical protein